MRRAGVVVLGRAVVSDVPLPPYLTAVPGLYEAVANDLGAVCVVLPEGRLGLKPVEFSWVEMEDWLAEFWDGDSVRCRT